MYEEVLVLHKEADVFIIFLLGLGRARLLGDGDLGSLYTHEGR